jgi:hypothetical protein
MPKTVALSKHHFVGATYIAAKEIAFDARRRAR